MTASRIGVAYNSVGWDRARLSIVVPIGFIVAVAIGCVVVAVLGSAQRADQVALEQEQRLFVQAITNHGERVLRELESVAASERVAGRIGPTYDADWVQRRIGRWLEVNFHHDLVFVADGSDRLIFAWVGGRSMDPNWVSTVRPDLAPVLDHLRGRSEVAAGRIIQIKDPVGPASRGTFDRAAFIQKFLGRPTIVAGSAVNLGAVTANEASPIIVSAKFIDDVVLGDIATNLQLPNLRHVDGDRAENGDHVYSLAEKDGASIARFAWTSQRPGADIVRSVFPFIAIAIGGFALLAGLVLRHMRRTSATIAAGETRLRHLALHDPLCELPNRIYFGERLEEVIADVRGGAPAAAVFYIDLDHFKDVNDTLGHPVGDELIRRVTKRLTHTIREGDMVARLGGDEFAVLSLGGADEPGLQSIANRVIGALCAPYSINGQTIVIGASIGIAVIHEHVGGAADIMRHADMALYRAKNEGRNRACIYDAAMDADLLKRKLLENSLRAAIENDLLRVEYQPIVNSSGDVVVGVEALCRWTHPDRGEIPPAEFIPVAEDSGLIIELGEKVLRQACLDGNAWADIFVAVNVSPLQFRRADFVDMVERILAETEFDPSRLELEVTESTLLGNVETAEVSMFRLKALGVRLALDDFGTGYSSLLYLRRFPFDKLKVDSSFVRSIEKAADAAAIVHAVVSLGRGLGMKVTAEGVETAEQHLFLRAAGVHSMQGYRFGRPCPAAQMSIRLTTPANFRISDHDVGLAMAG